MGARTTYTWDVAAGVALNAGTSTISIGTNATHNQPAYFQAGLGKQYHTVHLHRPRGAVVAHAGVGRRRGGHVRPAHLRRLGRHQRQQCHCPAAGLAAGHVYTFNSTTQTFAPNAQLSAVGDCGGFMTISGASATAAGHV